jgi:hypothetical protein
MSISAPQNIDVREAKLRARDYWYVDGLARIVLGMGTVLFGGIIWLYFSRLHFKFGIGVALTVALFVIVISHRALLGWLKERVTYPRTGYVPPLDPQTEYALQPPRPPFWKRFSSLKGWSTSLPAMAGVVMIDFKTPWICLVASLLFGVSACFEENRNKHTVRIFLLGMAFVGLCMSFFPLEQNARFGELFVGYGIVCAVDGAAKLLEYIRENPVVRA